MNGTISRRKNRNLVIAIILIILLIFGALYYFLVVPLKKDVEAAKSQLQIEEELLRILEENREVKEDNDDQFADNLERLPGDSYLEYYLMQLEEVASAAGVKIIDYSFSLSGATSVNSGEKEATEGNDKDKDGASEKSNQSGTVQQVNTSISVMTSTYEKLFRFLEELEQLKRITYVSSFSISDPGELEEGEEFTISFSLRSFYLPGIVDGEEVPEPNGNFVGPSGKEYPF